MLLSKRKDLKRDGHKILNKINIEQIKKYNIHLTETLVEAGSGSSPEQKLESMVYRSNRMRLGSMKLQKNLECRSYQ